MAWDEIPEDLKQPLYELAAFGDADDENVQKIQEYMYEHHLCGAEVIPAMGPRYDHGGLPAEYCENVAMVDSDRCEEHQESL